MNAEGYVHTQQHDGPAHAEGWPFPLWMQAGGIGWHFRGTGVPGYDAPPGHAGRLDSCRRARRRDRRERMGGRPDRAGRDGPDAAFARSRRRTRRGCG